MASQRKAGALLGYANILAKNLVNLVYTPMLLSYVGQADYGVFQSSNSFVFSLTLLSFGFSEAYVRFYTQTVAHGGERDIRHLNGMYLTLYVAVTAAASSRASALPCVKAGRRSLPVLHARWLACAHTWGNSPTLTSSSASTSSATVFRLQSSGRAGSTTVVRPSGRTSATSICGVRQPDGCLTPLCTST